MLRQTLQVAALRLSRIGHRCESKAHWVGKIGAASLLSVAADMCGLMNMAHADKAKREGGKRS